MKIGIVFLVVALWGVSAGAQPFAPTPEEAEHNATALELAATGDFSAAIEEQRKAVDLRGLNIFWLNLGRFQQRAGLCPEAVESYTRAMTSPAVTQPNADIVRETAQKYMVELAAQCPGRVRLNCVPADLAVVLSRAEDPNPPMPVACGQEFSLAGGTWRFRGTYGTEVVERVEEIRIARSYEFDLVVEVPVAQLESSPAPAPAPQTEAVLVTPSAPQARPKRTGAVVMIATGVTAVLAAVVIDVAPASARNGELDALDVVPVGLYVVGAALVTIGALVW